MLKPTLSFFFLILLVFSCKTKEEKYHVVYEDGEELLTGALGVNYQNANAFGLEVPGLVFKDHVKFVVGNSLFKQAWVSSPASTIARDGLGPTFNARACASCHFKDGRGFPLLVDKKANGFLMRVSTQGKDTFNGPLGVPNYGLQIQDKSNRGIPFEAKITVNYNTIHGTYADGKNYTLYKPNYRFKEENFGTLKNVMTSPRVAPQTIGMGLISALPDA